jgi:hypothetical protein
MVHRWRSPQGALNMAPAMPRCAWVDLLLVSGDHHRAHRIVAARKAPQEAPVKATKEDR